MMDRVPSKTNQQLQVEVDHILSNCQSNKMTFADIEAIAVDFEKNSGFDVARFRNESDTGEITNRGIYAYAEDTDGRTVRVVIGIRDGKSYIDR